MLETCTSDGSSTEEPSNVSQPVDDLATRRKAEMIAKGRKAKRLKRQADSNAPATALKVCSRFPHNFMVSL